jgi:hypothetical protein
MWQFVLIHPTTGFVEIVITCLDWRRLKMATPLLEGKLEREPLTLA